MASSTSFRTFITVAGFAGFAHAACKAAQFPQGSQYIRFSGTVNAKVNWEQEIVPAGTDHTTESCFQVWTAGPHVRSDLCVGVNPPWDKNPFFFELNHLISHDCGFFCQSSDQITNLYFASASYECYRGDTLCIPLLRGDHYEPKMYLDLNSGRAQSQQTQVGGQPGYSVKGGPDSWIGEVDGNGVDVRADCQWVFGQGREARTSGYSWSNFVWDKTNPLDYDLVFSNNSATVTLTTKMFSPSLNRVISTLTLSFEGSRNDTQEQDDEKSFHDLNPVQLNPGNASAPEFRFANGSQIYFATGKQGWTVAATPLPQTTARSSVSRRPSSTAASTATSSSRNAAPTRVPGGHGSVLVTVVIVEAMVHVFRMI